MEITQDIDTNINNYDVNDLVFITSGDTKFTVSGSYTLINGPKSNIISDTIIGSELIVINGSFKDIITDTVTIGEEFKEIYNDNSYVMRLPLNITEKNINMNYVSNNDYSSINIITDDYGSVFPGIHLNYRGTSCYYADNLGDIYEYITYYESSISSHYLNGPELKLAENIVVKNDDDIEGTIKYDITSSLTTQELRFNLYGSAYNIDGSIIELGTISYFFNSNGRLRISTLYIDSDDIRLHYDDTNYTWITLKDYIKDIVQELIQ